MDAARWDHVQRLFHAALEQPTERRRGFVETGARGDAALASDVLRMLEADGAIGTPLDRGLAHLAAEVLRVDTAELPTTDFGPYRVTRLLGEGGMGVVYLARREDLGSVAAIKILRDAWLSPARRERFVAEQRTLAQLSHPSIAQLHDADTLPDGTPWFVMEYVEGVSLTDYCRDHRTSIEGRLELFRAVCEAVQHAHGHAVIHRDLKPSNILVTADGTVKLLDFGIAKHLEDAAGTVDQTRTGLRLMTPAYAAPEQVRGERVGTRTDIYSLGVILYELLTGRTPFDLTGKTPAEAMSIVVDREPERPSDAARRGRGSGAAPRARTAGHAAWADLDVLCLTAMHKDPARRYQTVEALIRDLDHYLAGEPLEARPDTLRYRLGKFARRNRAAVTATAGVLAVLAGMAVFYTVRLTRARNVAVAEAARTQRIQRFMVHLFQGGDEAAGPADSLRVITLVERGISEARNLEGEPLVQAELYQTLGTISRQLGDLPRADSLLTLSLERRRALLGGSHPDVAEGMVALGALRVEQARYDEGEALIREALALDSAALPPAHPAALRARSELGQALQARGAYDSAIVVQEQLVAAYAAGGESADLATSLSELASTHFYAGHYDLADSLNTLVLGMSRRLYGDRHPMVAEDLINLGATQLERGDYAKAEAYDREALAITRAWYGDAHPKTAATLTLLARALLYQKRPEEAQALLQEALVIREGVYGPDHPMVASTVNELGNLAAAEDRYDDAVAHFTRMVQIYRTAYGGRHYLIGTALSNLASAYGGKKEYARAEPLYREAVAMFEATLGPDHSNTAIAHIKLGRALLRQRRFAEAAPETLAGYEILKPTAAPGNGFLRAARIDLAATYDTLGQPAKAAVYRAELADSGR